MAKLQLIGVLLVLVLAIFIDNSEGKRKKIRPTVEVAGYGKFLGKFKTTAWTERKYLKFDNIKYAVAPVRFMASTPYAPENKTEDKGDSEEEHDKDGYVINWHKGDTPACPSLETLDDFDWDDNDHENLEDCLFLSVSTKNVTGNQPVMVYLAGHDAIRGESDLREAVPMYLLEKDIILVVVQYRVGPFGFISMGTNDMPGNVGILDIIEALRWVQKYASNFGGDPSRVTLFGQYHSAALINVLTMSPKIEKENLFNQVIYQSGSALLEDIASDKPVDWVKKISAILKCEPVEDMAAVAKCLSTANIRDLLKAYQQFLEENKEFPFITIGGSSGILSDFPKKLLEAGNFRGYPTIGGSVKHPGVCATLKDMNSTRFREEYKKDLDNLKALLEKVGGKNDDQTKFVEEKFPNMIFFNNIYKAVLPALIDIKGLDIKHATAEMLQHNVEKGSPTFLYAFNYLGSFSRLDCSKETLSDVSLADDSIYLFPFPKKVEHLSWKDVKMAKFIVDLWTSFAATGNPTGLGLHKWPEMEKGNLGPYLGIDFIYKIGFDYSEEYFVTLKDQMKDVNIYSSDVHA